MKTPSERFIAALELPSGARQSTRISKKVLSDQATTNPSDRKLLEHGIDDVIWAATLKPSTIAVPAFRDDTRDWGEIAVIRLSVRDGIDSVRVAALLHRAIPYPLLLVAETRGGLQITCARIRLALNDEAKRVAEAPVVAALIGGPLDEAFLAAWALSGMPTANMATLYEAFIARLESRHAAAISGQWLHSDNINDILKRRKALSEWNRLDLEAKALRKTAGKARSIRDRVDLNKKVQLCLKLLEEVKSRL
ncbi:MAG: DUF4391 domain-containing protein [Aquidulcibacter sp.]